MKIIKNLAATLLALSLAACSSINPGMAARLAETGSATSNDTAELYTQRGKSLERYLEGECMISALSDGYSQPTKKMIESVDSVNRSLRARGDIFAKLAKTYKAFGRLAQYDDNGKLEESIHALSDAINENAALIGATPAVSQTDADLAALAGRTLFTAYHQSKIRSASRIIRGELKKITKLLNNPKEKTAILAVERVKDKSKLKLATKLWKLGLALPNEIVDKHIEVYGLIPNKSSTMRQLDRSTTGKMKDAIAKILIFRNKSESRAREQAYAATINALNELIAAHESLERGVPPSFDSIARNIREIREYLLLIKKKGAVE